MFEEVNIPKVDLLSRQLFGIVMSALWGLLAHGVFPLQHHANDRAIHINTATAGQSGQANQSLGCDLHSSDEVILGHIEDAFLLTSKVGLLLQMNGAHSDELEDDCGLSFNKFPGLCLNQPPALGR